MQFLFRSVSRCYVVCLPLFGRSGCEEASADHSPGVCISSAVSVELSQSCFGAYPDETLFVSEDAAYIGRQSFFEGDLLIVVMFCAEREGSYQ